jgi:hypothetical protein
MRKIGDVPHLRTPHKGTALGNDQFKEDGFVPPGVSYTFASNYENQIRAHKRLSVILPLLLHASSAGGQFCSLGTTMMVFWPSW